MFTPAHRGGPRDAEPLVLLHGFTETWRSWELVLPMLERRHDVLAITLAGHAGGPPLGTPLTDDTLVVAVEAAMDDAGFATAHVAGNSLGGHVALQLAERGRARSVVALAPAGGWAADDPAPRALLAEQRAMVEELRRAPAPTLLAATPDGRRRATQLLVERSDHLDAAFVGHLLRAVAACDAEPMLAHAAAHGWPRDPARIACPVRVVWGTADRLLPWPRAAHRYAHDWLPHADWVVLDGAGHAPHVERPLEAAQLILGWSAP